MTELQSYCSEECLIASRLFMAQLDETPAHLRSGQPPSIKLDPIAFDKLSSAAREEISRSKPPTPDSNADWIIAQMESLRVSSMSLPGGPSPSSPSFLSTPPEHSELHIVEHEDRKPSSDFSSKETLEDFPLSSLSKPQKKTPKKTPKKSSTKIVAPPNNSLPVSSPPVSTPPETSPPVDEELNLFSFFEGDDSDTDEDGWLSSVTAFPTLSSFGQLYVTLSDWCSSHTKEFLYNKSQTTPSVPLSLDQILEEGFAQFRKKDEPLQPDEEDLVEKYGILPPSTPSSSSLRFQTLSSLLASQ